jgi:hypothetical protein
MSGPGSMRRIWMGVAAALALLSFYPAWTGYTSWWMPGIAFVIFLAFAFEPWFLTWELRRRGEELQITDEGVLRRLARGESEFVRWKELREVSIVVTQGVNFSEEFFYVLAGSGTSGVLVGQRLAAQHDLVSHLAKLPGFDHRNITNAMASPVNQRFLLWRSAAIEGEALVIPAERLTEPGAAPRRALH